MACTGLNPLPRFRQDIQTMHAYATQDSASMAELVVQVFGPIAADLACGEGLQAHARAAEMHLEY